MVMKAITIDRYGGPEVLQRREIRIPEPGANEVLVRVACAGINFMDIHTRQGKYALSRSYPVRLPCTLGMEGAGKVVKVGRDVTRSFWRQSGLVYLLGQLCGVCVRG